MAKDQRGKTTTSPSKKTDTEKQTEDTTMVFESSDDEAPEEVTFDASRTEALRSMKQALDTARREKELLKEKRRKRQELFQEQKKIKLLSDDVLEEMDSASSKKQKQSEAAEEQRQDEGENGKKKKKKSRKMEHSRNLKGNYRVATVKVVGALASSQQQAAEDFIQSRLYGAGSCRTTNNELLSLQNKTGRNKGAAVQFVKKDWACKQKAKAEKLKKRWIHKQHIPSC
ncbi:nucleolar protein 7-like isoform X1 [Echeneis naucrates]|uniref:nucleolar protein 7-like isoform X1 n=1 Tax=Echeneis naucrates TaxID=173247 RepID=UPI0011133EFA|nr:nucleolar protein 7-like isoform X1 [Echeneis naucrates]